MDSEMKNYQCNFSNLQIFIMALYLLPYISLILIFLVSLFIYLLRKNFNYWRVRQVSHNDPILFFGTHKDFFLGKLCFGESISKQYNDWPNEKLVGTFNSRRPEVIIRDPDLIRQVLIKDFTNFYLRGGLLDDKKEPLLGNLFHLNNEKWKVLRQRLTPVFTSGKMRNMFSLIKDRSDGFNQSITEQIKRTDIFEIRDLMSRYTMDVIGSCAFGVDINSMKDDNTPFREIGRLSFEHGFIKIIRKIIENVFPEIYKLFKMRMFKKKVEEFMQDFVKNVVNMRLNEISRRNDFIDLMIDLRNTGSIKGNNINKKTDDSVSDEVDMEITDNILMANVFLFFVAGFETSSTATAFTLYELALHPEIQEHLYKCICEVLEKSGGSITYENVQEIDYLDKVLSEGLRKYPPLSTLTRKCTSPYTFPYTNVTIDHKCTVIIPVLALHYDPQYYPNPDVFDPERFSPEVKNERDNMTYLPFGEGPRNCIGLRFAKIQSMVGLITIIKNYKVEVCEKTVKKLTLNPSTFITTAKGGLWLRLKQR